MVRLTCRSDLIMNALITFYKKPGNIERMLEVIRGHSRVSLRLLDFFAANYSKAHNITLTVKAGDEEDKASTTQLVVHSSYKSQLRAYSKRNFDPFCRGNHIAFEYADNELLTTTVGQLNFFRWIISNPILEYVEGNVDPIEAEMKQTEDAQLRKKRTEELSLSASRSICKNNDVKMLVTFDLPSC